MERETITVYLDADFKCHVAPADGRTPFDTDFFKGREDQIEHYRIVPFGSKWVREDGTEFEGEMMAPI